MSSPIYILHPQRDEIVDTLTNEGKKLYWNEKHIRDLRTGEDKFTFTTLSETVASGLITERTRLVVEADLEGFNEFIVFNHRTTMKDKQITAIAAYVDMEKSINVIQPGSYTGTLSELMDIALLNTGYKKGYIEFSGAKTIEIEKHIKPYSFIKRLSELFNTEINARLEIRDNDIQGRYIDHLRRIGLEEEKEIRVGKDLTAMEIVVDSDTVVTALYCVGPERDDGTFLEVLVTNEEARQRWGKDSNHLVDIYSPESIDKDMTLEELIQYGTTELNKRIAAVFNYRFDVVSIEHIYEHERMTLGDQIRVVNDEMDPPLYTRSRIVRMERTLSKKVPKIVEVGEVVLYKPEDIERTLTRFRKAYNTKLKELAASKNAVLKQPTKPSLVGRIEGDTWFDTSNGNKMHTYNETIEDFEESKFDYQALAVDTLSAITANLGTVTAGAINGASFTTEDYLGDGNTSLVVIDNGKLLIELLNSTFSSQSVMDVSGRGLTYSHSENLEFGFGVKSNHNLMYVARKQEDAKAYSGISPGVLNLRQGVDNSFLGGTNAYMIITEPTKSTVQSPMPVHTNYDAFTNRSETGRCGVGGIAVTGITSAIAGNAVTFKTKKTYIPATITRTAMSATSANLQVARITEEGFWCYIDGDQSGVYRYWDGTYQA